MTPVIGSWVRRRYGLLPDGPLHGKWHVTESVIEGAAITRCGRRMEPDASRGPLEVSAVEPLTRLIDQPQLCRLCA